MNFVPPSSQPFDLSKALANPPADGLIQVPSGTFTILADGIHNKCTANGITLRGNGYQRTVIQRDPSPEYAVNNQAVLWFAGNDVTVEDVTLDANAPLNNPDGTPGSGYAYSCLLMHGSNPSVRRVHGINPTGNWDNQTECWTFFFNTSGVGLVEQCTVSNVKGNYVEGFSVGADCGLVKIRDCHVQFPSLRDNAHPPFFNGFQGGGMTMDNCTQEGGTGLFYAEDSTTCPRISNCKATNVMQGIVIVRKETPIDGLVIDGNVIELSPLTQAAQGANGIVVYGPASKRNCRFTNNLVRFVDGQPPAASAGQFYSIGVVDGDRSGSVIMENVFDESMLQPVAESSATIHVNPACARAMPSPSPT